MNSDQKPLVMKYLESNGFPFEMKVAAEFQRKGFGIHQSVYYTDPYTKVAREIDLIAMWQSKINDINFNVFFIIECKYANVPWVVFSAITKGFPTCYINGGRGYNWLEHLVKQNGFETFFELEQSYGYGVSVTVLNKRVKAKNKDFQSEGQQENTKDDNSPKENAYKAMQCIMNFLKAEIASSRFSTPSDYTFFVPVIAIRGELYRAYIDDKAKIDCDKINEAQIFHKENVSGVIPKVHIVTEDILESYISKLRTDCEKLFTLPYRNEAIAVPFAPRYFG